MIFLYQVAYPTVAMGSRTGMPLTDPWKMSESDQTLREENVVTRYLLPCAVGFRVDNVDVFPCRMPQTANKTPKQGRSPADPVQAFPSLWICKSALAAKDAITLGFQVILAEAAPVM